MNYLGEDGLGCPQRTAERGMGRGMARVFQTERETHARETHARVWR